jgi:hypothetical protein
VIVRILGEGQYSLPDDQRGELEAWDSSVADAVDRGDEQAFGPALAALVAEVRRLGEPVAHDTFAPSDLVVPFPDATLAETRGLLADSTEAPGADDR